MRVEVFVNGVFGGRFARERLTVELAEGATLQELLAQVKRRSGLDLLALDMAGPAILLSGRRLDLPAETATPLTNGDLLAVLSPLAGGVGP